MRDHKEQRWPLVSILSSLCDEAQTYSPVLECPCYAYLVWWPQTFISKDALVFSFQNHPVIIRTERWLIFGVTASLCWYLEEGHVENTVTMNLKTHVWICLWAPPVTIADVLLNKTFNLGPSSVRLQSGCSFALNHACQIRLGIVCVKK